jgi:membrane-bound lytic murein transglycosylase D
MAAITERFLRLRSRLAYPALAVAMGLSTVIAGLDHTRFLVQATGTDAAITQQADSAVRTPVAILLPDSTVALVAPAAFATNTIQHSRIDAWITKFTTSLKGDFAQSLTRMDKYDAMITRKLDARDMPHELIYLAMIESNFNPTARSRVGAVGMWQFMSGTARSFGLTVKGHTDERKNPDDATDAALSYLSQLHTRFGSWYLAAAAYNSGAGTIAKALKKVTGKTQGTDEDFFRIMSSLPKETQDYVPKLIAAARVGSAPAQYGLKG